MPPKNQMVSKKAVNVDVLNLSDQVKICNSLKGSLSLAEVGWCYGKK
jgi:hypothetical protein